MVQEATESTRIKMQPKKVRRGLDNHDRDKYFIFPPAAANQAGDMGSPPIGG